LLDKAECTDEAERHEPELVRSVVNGGVQRLKRLSVFHNVVA
jgi:hypothetical protein